MSDISWHTEKRTISDLVDWEKNPRYISDAQFEHLKTSIEKFNFTNPPIVNTDGVLIAGHKRLKAMRALGRGGEQIDVRIPSRELTQKEHDELAIRDNKNTGQFDWDGLANFFEAEELTEWGFSDEELFGDGFFEQEAEEDDFEVPDEEDIETEIQLGDLIEIGRHRLLCGDSTEKGRVEYLLDEKEIDFVFTSPPYNGDSGIGKTRGGMKNEGFYLSNEKDSKSRSEYIDFNKSVIDRILENVSSDCVLFYNLSYNKKSPNAYIDIVSSINNDIKLIETIVWKKSLSVSLKGNNLTRIVEFIFAFYNGKGKPKINKDTPNESINNFWEINNVGASHEVHRACFPIELVSKALKYYSIKSDICYDSFLGSGTTMVAAHQLDRTCYGMELDPKYCQVIIERMLKLDPELEVKVNGEPYNELDPTQ